MAYVPSVSEWYSNKNVLITGGTGYIGKSIVEKLLRSCPDVGTIYLLLRKKRGQGVETRLENLKKSEIFSFNPVNYDWSKVKPIAADPSVPGCGFREEDENELKERVNIVFHAAATIRFDERLINAINFNVRFTYDMVNLAKNMRNFMIFVQVSTAFSNSDRIVSDEIVYPTELDWKKALSVLNTGQDGKDLDAITAQIIGRHPNTYTFTKKMAENVVWDHRNDVPIVIFRPVIVTSTMNEPAAGWSDNFSGPEVMYYLLGKGILRAIYIHPDSASPYCPGDITTNTAIVAAWKAACFSKVRQETHEEVISSTYFLQSIRQGIALGEEAIKETPIPNILWVHYFISCTNDVSFLFCFVLFNLIPAVFFQAIAMTTGKKVMLIKAMRKMFVTMDLVKVIMATPYSFKVDNHMKLFNALSEKDKLNFNIIISKSGRLVPSSDEILEYLKGSSANVFRLMGEPKISREVGLKQRQRMEYVDTACRVTFLAIFLWYFPYDCVWSAVSSCISFPQAHVI